MPRQSAASAANALSEYLSVAPVLSLGVVKEGFEFAGEDLGLSGLGAGDLSGLLQSHGVAELSFLPGCTTEELIAFLAAALSPPEEILEAGGLAAVMAGTGVQRVSISEVALTVAEDTMPAEDQDIAQFLRELVGLGQQFLGRRPDLLVLHGLGKHPDTLPVGQILLLDLPVEDQGVEGANLDAGTA